MKPKIYVLRKYGSGKKAHWFLKTPSLLSNRWVYHSICNYDLAFSTHIDHKNGDYPPGDICKLCTWKKAKMESDDPVAFLGK